jgi:hypothetical protein
VPRDLTIMGPSVMDAQRPPNIPEWPPLWSYATAPVRGWNLPKQLQLLLRPWSRPVGAAPRQRQNQAKQNPIKYDAARLCLPSHQHGFYPADFNILGERVRGAIRRAHGRQRLPVRAAQRHCRGPSGAGASDRGRGLSPTQGYGTQSRARGPYEGNSQICEHGGCGVGPTPPDALLTVGVIGSNWVWRSPSLRSKPVFRAASGRPFSLSNPGAALSFAELLHDPTHRRGYGRSRCRAVAPGSHNLAIVIGEPGAKVPPCRGLHRINADESRLSFRRSIS